MTEETTTPVEETAVAEAPVAEEQPRLNLNDLAILVQAVDIGANAGAYKGNDLEAIGSARNRVAAFVNINSPAPTTPETSE